MGRVQVKAHVEDVMRIVELDVIRNSIVGVPGQSGDNYNLPHTPKPGYQLVPLFCGTRCKLQIMHCFFGCC